MKEIENPAFDYDNIKEVRQSQSAWGFNASNAQDQAADRRWKLACFDLDGTLVRGTSTGEHLAAKIGHLQEMREMERKYAAGLVSNTEVAALDGRFYRDFSLRDIAAMLDDVPLIKDIAETVSWLARRGIPAVICTIAWKFVGETIAERFGFIGSSGPALLLNTEGAFTGAVELDFTEHDKPVFVQSLCDSLGITMSEVFHVGDSRSDIPLFKAVGFSIALNANELAKASARVSIDSDSLLSVIDIVPGLKEDNKDLQ